MASYKDIPSDIVELSILPKLPSKTLLKFMSVSRSWYSLIKNPKFIACHLNHHKSLSRHSNKLILLRIYHKPSLITYYLYRHDNPVCRYTKLRSPSPKFDHVVASYDGVVCFYDNACNLLLWNPSIDKFRSIPRLPKIQVSECAFGFGYNSLEDNYKLVMINFEYIRSYIYDNIPWGFPAFAYVCSFNKKREECLGWSQVSLSKVFAYVNRISNCCFVNDMIHWIIFRDYIRDDTISIMTFDIKTDRFGEITIPDINIWNYVELAVISNSVAVVEFIELDAVVVWRMDECEAWKVFYTIELSRAMNKRVLAKEHCFQWLSSLPLPVTRFVSTMLRKRRHQVVITTSSGKALIVFKDSKTGNSGVFRGALAMTDGKAFSCTESLVLL